MKRNHTTSFARPRVSYTWCRDVCVLITADAYLPSWAELSKCTRSCSTLCRGLHQIIFLVGSRQLHGNLRMQLTQGCVQVDKCRPTHDHASDAHLPERRLRVLKPVVGNTCSCFASIFRTSTCSLHDLSTSVLVACASLPDAGI